MASVLRGLGKTVLGAGAFYFLVMRNLDSVADYCNERYLVRAQEQRLLQQLAQEKQAMLEQEGS